MRNLSLTEIIEVVGGMTTKAPVGTAEVDILTIPTRTLPLPGRPPASGGPIFAPIGE